ncbi:MAG: O-methyltransferase [Acidimicrobiia bacterium]
MASIPRPTLEEAARAWLDTKPDGARRSAQLRAALEDFVGKRFRGAATELRAVHDLRQRLLEDQRPLDSLHEAATGPWDSQTLGAAASHSAPPDQGRLLFHLTRSLAPNQVLELGTNIGISAAYLALGQRYGDGGTVTSVEASGVRRLEARRIHTELGVTDVDLVEGYFDDVLPSLLDRLGRVDLAFLDGNHQLDATVRYFEMLAPQITAGGMMVLDDIRWSEGMLEAWNRIVARPEASTTVDLGRTGLVIVA